MCVAVMGPSFLGFMIDLSRIRNEMVGFNRVRSRSRIGSIDFVGVEVNEKNKDYWKS